MELNRRKPNRLNFYDYSSNGAYFITVCIKERHNILWDDVGATFGRPLVEVHLSRIGEIVNQEVLRIHDIHGEVEVPKYVIMPNHIHMIILLNEPRDGRPKVAPTVSRIIQQFKGSITKQIGYTIWQKLFYDHIIRNDEEYLKIWHYIDTNPLKWKDDVYYR